MSKYKDTVRILDKDYIYNFVCQVAIDLYEEICPYIRTMGTYFGLKRTKELDIVLIN